jgi:hypothetical protein
MDVFAAKSPDLGIGRAMKPVKLASHFHTSHAEDFVGHLRTIRVSPNGHPKPVKRPLLIVPKGMPSMTHGGNGTGGGGHHH